MGVVVTDGVPGQREPTETRSRLPDYRFPMELSFLGTLYTYKSACTHRYFYTYVVMALAVMRTLRSAEASGDCAFGLSFQILSPLGLVLFKYSMRAYGNPFIESFIKSFIEFIEYMG